MRADYSQRPAEPVQGYRILDEDAVAHRLVGRPCGQQVEQHRIVRFAVGRFTRMRPVAPPHQALGSRFHKGARDGRRFRVRWAELRIRIGARELDPRPAAVDEIADDAIDGCSMPSGSGGCPM